MLWRSIFCVAALSLTVIKTEAALVSDIRNTAHNFSSSSTNAVRATTETEICVFCHTPHNADASAAAPLWNRAFSTATYTLYNSSSMDAAVNQPGLGSKLCLSCHDGTLAIGAVNVLNGRVTDRNGTTAEITMLGTNNNKMPDGAGATTGDTRNLGVNLTNDHPIAFTYNSALAAADGDLRDPATTTSVNISNRAARTNTTPDIPLLNNQVECISCHDPHVRDTTNENIKFLRLNRFQVNAGPGSDTTFSKTNDIICLACHSKQGWTDSAHANPLVANELYTSTAAAVRDFPNALPVWRAACLNCHDTHTVQGARRLLREGTDSTASPKAGGNSAIEETCYQCHSTGGNTLTRQGIGTEVPDIKSDFSLARRMPITNTEQGVANEVHDIGTGTGSQRGKEFIESPALLGKGNLNNRHVECTDCHNPHRVTRMRSAFADPAIPDADGTHDHSGTTRHTNLISGVLRGMWGVEPQYGATAWDSLPTSYIVKSGLQPRNGSTDVTNSYVTREYQICLKCHSDYAYDDTNRPLLGYPGGTPSGTNSMTQYTNQAMEFQAPLSEAGWPGRNHRSWHPVMAPTGRTMALRTVDANVFLPPWNSNNGADIGFQTMYCTDCHGSNTANGNSGSGIEGGSVSGPHGSSNNFILKGTWSNVNATNNQGFVCFKCHDYNDYANTSNNAPQRSGFRDPNASGMCMVNFASTNLHIGHAGRLGGIRCNWCHTMVPHGWRNKALLVDISQVSTSAGGFTQGPYYVNAWLGGGGPVTFAASGQWDAANCGGGGGGGMMGGGGNWMYMSCRPNP